MRQHYRQVSSDREDGVRCDCREKLLKDKLSIKEHKSRQDGQIREREVYSTRS